MRPLNVASQLLSSKWRLEEGEEEFTIMHVVVEGRKGDKDVRYTYELYDEYDRKSGTPSMARTTGFPCTIMARLLTSGQFADPGVFPLELLAGRESLLECILEQPSARGVNLTTQVE